MCVWQEIYLVSLMSLQIRDGQQVQTQGIIKTDPTTGVSEENGTSILDGILRKDFGSLTKDEKSNVTFNCFEVNFNKKNYVASTNRNI